MTNLDHSLKAAADFGELPALRLKPLVAAPAPRAVERRRGPHATCAPEGCAQV